ncbi:MAG: hypothetical protein HQL74_07450 [Magnetococcales bacterium]|nr:hypothetical protein [Magnetococcales bacterium]
MAFMDHPQGRKQIQMHIESVPREHSDSGCSGENKLWRAVFLLGLRDMARLIKNPNPDDYIWRRSAAQVVMWCSDGRDKIGSLHWICEQLDMDYCRIKIFLKGTMLYLKRRSKRYKDKKYPIEPLPDENIVPMNNIHIND